MISFIWLLQIDSLDTVNLRLQKPDIDYVVNILPPHSTTSTSNHCRLLVHDLIMHPMVIPIQQCDGNGDKRYPPYLPFFRPKIKRAAKRTSNALGCTKADLKDEDQRYVRHSIESMEATVGILTCGLNYTQC